ncbi:MAG: Spy/CpxP family protein refolding chaperone, partial [Gemmatimonadota bacterium]
ESPYAAYGDREIMALSPEEIDGLRAGEGMGMAVPAELHGYPGPRHVLELASELELTRSQVEATKTVFDSMATRARALGREIVELERDLDAAFEEGTVTHEELDRLVGEIARRRAELRTVHLGAHLELRPVLTEEQRDAYDRIRGYDD